jgi:hypothetical protein
MQAMNELSDLRREVENLRVLLNDERSGVAAELRKLEKRIERLEVGSYRVPADSGAVGVSGAGAGVGPEAAIGAATRR